MRPQDIEIGTSGWKFDDWAGSFYPHRIPKTKWLEYYSARFSVGEINSTYFRIAPFTVYESIAKRTPDKFRMFAKVHADVTHERKDAKTSMQNLQDALKPLMESGKLLGFLAQFPGSFRCTSENLDYVLRLRDSCGAIPLCTEFRHNSWTEEEAISSLTENSIYWVCPDEPNLENLITFQLRTTSDFYYLRLHGRNAATWHHPERGDRYDYQYSEQELAKIGNDLLKMETSAKRGFVFFNNCHAGRAPINAWWLKMWLGAMDPSSTENSDEPFGFSAD
jgi:uncharacterized protein YecE (DUF72 family)